VVGEWKLARWIDDIGRGCHLRDADGDGHLDLHRDGVGQCLTNADGLGPGIDYGERGVEHVGDYNDEPGGREERELVQCIAEREWRNSELYVVHCVGESPGRPFAVERRRHFRNADGEWHWDIYGSRARQRIACADGLGE
jgi:hypothetical protein